MTEFIGRLVLFLGITLGLFGAVHVAQAEDQTAPIEVTIKDHRFSPSEIHVKAGTPTFLEVANQDSEPEEFEMRQLAIEKVIPAGGKGKVRLRPLGPGRYTFIGEYHQDTAQGAVVSE